MKPALSLVSTVSLPRLFPHSAPAWNASSDEATERTTSSSVITCTGLKKWRPMKLSGRFVAAACAITGSDEVLVAKTAPSLTTPSSSRHISSFWSRSSVIASTTRSQSARSA